LIKFAKKNKSVKIPSKTDTNGGYDIYANFEEPFVKLKAHETTLVPTGLFSSFEKEWYIQFQNRGSNGSKGLLQACGVIDSSYRGEWFVAITNTNNSDWYIIKEDYKNLIPVEFLDSIKNTFYPYEKAICQFVLLPVPTEEIIEVEPEVIQLDKTNRGAGIMGSSGK
jgi:dUTP pyrophosphatase